MTTGVQAIETFYKGYRFRSRLEARWAVFFDTLGVAYEYEPEGFDLGQYGRYLPDFWLPKQQTFVEIKWRDQGEHIAKSAALAKMLLAKVLYVAGSPFSGEYDVFLFRGSDQRWNIDPLVFALGRRELPAVVLWVANESQASSLEPANGDREPLRDCAELHAAYLAARQARFEFGENGKRLPAVRPAIPPPPTSARMRITLVRLESYQGPYGQAIRWVFVDDLHREMMLVTNPRLSPKSKGIALVEALMGRTPRQGEDGAELARALLGTTAYADVERNEFGRWLITNVSAVR